MAVLKTLAYLMVLVVAGVVVGAIIIILGGCTTDSGMSRGERAIWFVESSHAGELAGYDDCENHRRRLATAHPGDFDSDFYMEGYFGAYDDCERSRRAYEQGKEDGAHDCRYLELARYSTFDSKMGTGMYADDYKRGYEAGYGPVDCLEPY